MAGRKKLAKGLDITAKRELMKESVETLRNRYIRRTIEGQANWAYIFRMVYPYLMFVANHPDFTPEQRMIATKEFWRRVKEGLLNFFMAIANEAVIFSKTMAITVSEVPPRPSDGLGYLPWQG